ncbi:MAG TPA: hypothetical protein VG184_08845 [Acidimicrobiales bacterium]|jgi:hypothetical protein|nr:hypothetical protein [Acidimicrobiales bacterium]
MATPLAPQAPPVPPPAGARARIPARTLRTDRWWVNPAVSAGVLVAFIAYSTWAAFQHADYFYKPYISPFYSPCLATTCMSARAGSAITHAPTVGIVGPWWAISPAIIVLIVPLGFRLTCYYYRKAYYRSFWQSPPACAVGEPHKRYSGETRFPLIVQNVHRYFFYLGLVFNAILTYDAVVSFRNHNDQWGHAGFGTLMLVVNAVLLWLYSMSCHSCRHIVGGRLKHFSRHPVRFKFWCLVTKLNTKHMQFAWASLVFVGLTDLYVRLVASGTIIDPRFF